MEDWNRRKPDIIWRQPQIERWTNCWIEVIPKRLHDTLGITGGTRGIHNWRHFI